MNTKPLEKSFLTGEGILVYATNIGLAVAAVLPHGLSWTQSGAYLAVLNGLHIVSRTALKVVAVQKDAGLPAPPTVDPVDPSVIASVISTAFGEDATDHKATVTGAGAVPTGEVPAAVPAVGQEPRGEEVAPQGA